MSVHYNEKLLLNQTLQGGYRISRVRRDRRMLSLCAKFACVGAVALVFTGSAIAAPAVAGPWANYLAGGVADAIAINGDDNLIQLAGCGSNCGKGLGPSGLGPPGNTGPGNQGNTTSVGNAGGFGGLPLGGGFGGGSGSGAFSDLSGGDPTLEPYLWIRANRGANGGGTSAQGRLGLGAAQMMCSVGGLSVAADGSVIFAKFFADQTGRKPGRTGCQELVRYPDTEDMAGN